MIYLLLILFRLGIGFHDIQIATYTISETDEVLNLKFTFEKDDLTKVLGEKDASNLSDQIQTYITTHFKIQINQKTSPINFKELVEDGKHIRIKAQMPKNYTSMDQLDIQNTCLLDLDGHSNIIQLRINEEERDFLMNKNRTTLQIEY